VAQICSLLTAEFDNRADFTGQLTGGTIVQTLELAKQRFKDRAISGPNLLKVLPHMDDTGWNWR
jgi:hypothetical protein